MLRCCPDPPIQSLECPRRAQKSGNLSFTRGTTSPFSAEKEKSSFLKMNEQRGNVIENKGPLWKTGRQSGNDIENKGGCASKAGMLLKTKDVDGMS